MNRKIHTLLDKIEHQLSITDTLMKELQSELLLADMQDEATLTVGDNQADNPYPPADVRHVHMSWDGSARCACGKLITVGTGETV